jgi:FtsP/CotA-like multicopper oxidase with cupredoxin domain
MQRLAYSFLLCGLLLILSLFGEVRQPSSVPLILQVKNRELTVNGKKAQVFEIVQLNGTSGLSLNKGEQFHVVLENHISSPTGVHWHGILLPNSQDGVPFVTQPPIAPGGKYAYNFPIIQSGTYWMHAHYGLQEQLLLTAPLILRDPNEPQVDQEVVMFLSDFTFRNPLEIFKELRNQGSKVMAPASDEKMISSAELEMDLPREKMNEKKMAKVDLNDVTYDAFLTNWRTLSNPQVVEVSPEKIIRLRIINGSSTTNFFIQLGKLTGEAIAVDGSDIFPLRGSQFELAVAQRIDIRIKLPPGSGVYPIIAQGEGLEMQTGLVLATAGATIPQFKEKADQAMGALSYQQERRLKAKNQPPKKEIDRRLILNLAGNMAKYVWLLNGKAWPDNEPLMVKEGERVELSFVNRTMMAHPMHLHGHFFQITEINGQALEGALRDTVLVLPHSIVKVQFDANNPGHWPLHCHNLYHQYAGMMTTLNYKGFKGPVFSKEEKSHEYAR